MTIQAEVNNPPQVIPAAVPDLWRKAYQNSMIREWVGKPYHNRDDNGNGADLINVDVTVTDAYLQPDKGQELISAGADISLGNSYRCTSLHMAAFPGTEDLTKLLVTLGVFPRTIKHGLTSSVVVYFGWNLV
ncbi:uncharacterized protein KD926_002292 [Aspergillus affinis]|uniref:uncharacterized protein n=1 Tax=Aspergillus affinis TaxID=1070780 RepID=UPI0022FEEB27|nr:uncharacterized protein KD926_002292 [Aspergillus affinis]KAI9043914.1 hypothetical protein KD926_002292 [Aspergillus affinis]